MRFEKQKGVLQDIQDPEVFRAVTDVLCGKKLGEGCSRTVYECSFDKSLVIKIEDRNYHSQNIIEWEVWDQVEYDKKLKKWFAPCIAISRCGTVLIQKKVKYRDIALYPKKIPAFFGDTHRKNFGFIGDQFVCSDYGFFISNGVGLNSKAMKTVKWRDHSYSS